MLSRLGGRVQCIKEPLHLRGGGDNDGGSVAPDTTNQQEEQLQEQELQEQEKEKLQEQEKEKKEKKENKQHLEKQQTQQQAALEEFITPGDASHNDIQENKERMLLRAAFHVRYVGMFCVNDFLLLNCIYYFIHSIQVC